MKVIKNLFIVDDDETFTFLTVKRISRTNLVENIKTFQNGLDILSYLKENKKSTEVLPDVILLDINMPIMDGWQFLERFEPLTEELKKNIVIYILSSSIFPGDIDRAKNSKIISDFIIKPFTDEKLLDITKKIAS
ncbi:MAG: response regulator [Winogradskyella sp.]|uniref:response regulator n=1 Tax=Winogradskyella sp. TaxID=1883156 RepID=UPI0025E61D25|nr:response regulator [Winogradskyella sp.]NRB58670.1 response regulator [Winogradskyella sp.]